MKYPIIQAKTEFHPVGQGCFYSGQILFEDNRIFNFVYDCGTNSDQGFLLDEISDHPLKKNNEILDLCVISHFHYDHVSGIPDLLRNTECRRLVIPYYDKIERLIIYLLSEETDGEHLLMLQDPLQYFAGDQFNIREIIVLGGATGNENPEVSGPVTPGPGQSDSGSEISNFIFDPEKV
jgi:glyoxylase-like metal-dependent hydrolase (beta-lactamase superfamily II)